jgi:hypothetical protein
MRKQDKEARSDANRYYFREKYDRDAYNDGELLEYYALNGGAKGFAEREAEYDSQGETAVSEIP